MAAGATSEVIGRSVPIFTESIEDRQEPLLLKLTLALALASIPFGLAYLLLQNLLLGIDQVRAYNGIELANKVIGLVLVGLVILSRRLSAELMFAATLVALVLSFLWVLWSLRGVFRHPVLFSMTVFRQHVGLGIKAYLIAFFGFLVLRIDLVMVKYMLGGASSQNEGSSSDPKGYLD